MEATKLGRCECRDANCSACLDGCTKEARVDVSARRDLFPCHLNAVRMVTVYGYKQSATPPPHASVQKQVPMCAACADFHEKRGAK